MKRISFLVISIHFALLSLAQMKINDLNIPTSPAFVLMDKSPASIEKPSNPKALSVSLINVWQNSGAIEFAPYWLADRPAYTFKENINKNFPLAQTFALSAATAKEDSITNIAAGFRTQLVRLYSEKRKNDIEAMRQKIVGLLSVDTEDLDEAAIKQAKKEMNKLLSKTQLNIELAAAYMGQSGPIQKLVSTKAGAWLNIRYTDDKIPFDFTGLARYSWSTNGKSKTGSDSAFFDYGINLSYKDTEFDIELEYVNRRDMAAKHNYDRFALVANYQVMPGIVVVASVGKEFKEVNNIFSMLGIKFGLSKEVAKLSK